MDRQKINEYFYYLVRSIVRDERNFGTALLYENGNDYDCSGEAAIVDEICEDFNVLICNGASKLVIISNEDNEIAKNYVVKIPFGYEEYNYCEAEVDTYRTIARRYEDFTSYFAECWRVSEEIDVIDSDGFQHWIPMYIMRRADIDTQRVEQDSFHYYLSKGGDSDVYCPDNNEEETFNCFRNQYGDDIVNDLEEICDELTIGDLHIANVGFINGEFPVFVDYSGYWG